MMFLLGITATAGAAFVAGRIYENRLQEMKRRARRQAISRRNRREAEDVAFMASIYADAPGVDCR